MKAKHLKQPALCDLCLRKFQQQLPADSFGIICAWCQACEFAWSAAVRDGCITGWHFSSPCRNEADAARYQASMSRAAEEDNAALAELQKQKPN